ncbi:hypothetical protein [Glycocaulis alkaliphilus]|nr:hypothetical protein [Glycocaulis alkaliphilus]GGB83500.1 hypothetical protein GCM10007417_24320 [Glycocaulis alkaliphilus]
MGRSVETRNWRITSERVGSVDWQDAMESFALYAALVEDEGAREVLMNMSRAEILISHSEAPELARMLARETPPTLAIAIVRPSHSNDARFIEVFTEELQRAGRSVGLFETLAEADAFLLAERQEGPAGEPGASGPLAWLKKLIAG